MTSPELRGLLLARGAVAVALVAGVVSFTMMETQPGDAAFRIAAGRYGHDVVDAAAAEAVRAELGLDAPALVRLLIWLGDLATLDLGRSLVTGAPVREEVASRLDASSALAAAAFAVSLLIALPAGVVAGMRPGGAVDRASFGASAALRVVPTFALAVLLILVFAVRLHWLPVAGHGGTAHFVLPALTLGLALGAVSSRVVRDAVAEVAVGGPMRFAHLKGLSDAAAMARLGPRNVAGPLAAHLGVRMALLVGGVVAESSSPGPASAAPWSTRSSAATCPWCRGPRSRWGWASSSWARRRTSRPASPTPARGAVMSVSEQDAAARPATGVAAIRTRRLPIGRAIGLGLPALVLIVAAL